MTKRRIDLSEAEFADGFGGMTPKPIVYLKLMDGYQEKGFDKENLLKYIKERQAEMADELGRAVNWRMAVETVLTELQNDFSAVMQNARQIALTEGRPSVEPEA